MGQHLRFRHVFSCESNKEKMQWISMVNSCTKECMHKIKKKWQGGDSPRHEGPQDEDEEAEESEDDPCIFMDICQLGGDHASCAVHGKQQRATTKASGRDSTKVSDRARGDQYQLALGNCPIPQVDILILGTSCKDMSRANPNKHKQKEAVLGKGGSAQTFRGMLEYVQHHSPAIVVFENVDTIDDRGATSNLDILLAEMGNRGYEHQVIMSDAALFGLPAR
ncbi:unnamed protein product, partial [Symbiodinium microadriaticum]